MKKINKLLASASIAVSYLICNITVSLASNPLVDALERVENTNDSRFAKLEEFILSITSSGLNITQFIVSTALIIGLITTGLRMKNVEDSKELAILKRKLAFQAIGLLIAVNAKNIMVFFSTVNPF